MLISRLFARSEYKYTPLGRRKCLLHLNVTAPYFLKIFGFCLNSYHLGKTISEENEKNRKEIKDLQRQIQYCYQKIGLVKYDAFNQMGGKLSFCLVLLNEKNNGFLLNSVHSSDGCYSYTKEITKGECELSLGEEEQKALDMAMKY